MTQLKRKKHKINQTDFDNLQPILDLENSCLFSKKEKVQIKQEIIDNMTTQKTTKQCINTAIAFKYELSDLFLFYQTPQTSYYWWEISNLLKNSN